MNKILKVLYPILLALAVTIGILLGSRIQQNVNRTNLQSAGLFQPDKLSIITRLIENDYVDSINKNDLIEKTVPLILDELDPHSSYIPAKEMKNVTDEMRGNF